MKKRNTSPKSQKASKDELNTVPPVVVQAKASPETRKAIAFFQDKRPAVDLLEVNKVDRRKKDHLKITPRSTGDKFWDFIADNKVGSKVILALATAFLVAVLYWGIKQ